MKRREFIALLGGAAVAWPLAARAQYQGHMQRVGVFMAYAETDLEAQSWVNTFRERLKELDGTDHIQFDYRWAAANVDRMRPLAREIVALQPDVILAHTTPVLTALLEKTRTIPIVFVNVTDPMGGGYVHSLARPGGNVTGFTNIPPTMIGKVLEMLKEIAPGVKRVGFIFNPSTAPGKGMFFYNPFETVAPYLGVKPLAIAVHDQTEIEASLASLASEPDSGLIVMPDAFTTTHRHAIIDLTARYRIPTIYPYRYMAQTGALISYGFDTPEMFRNAAAYVYRILKGAKPADLPVQAPTKYELAINARTAKALGLTIPTSLLSQADEVIE